MSLPVPGRRARRAAVITALLMAACLGLPALAGAAQVCSGVNAPTVSSVTSDTSLETTFTNYGNSGQGWTGADSTYSARMPDGSDLWAFSDTFLEPITPPARPDNAVMVHNTFIQQKGGTLTTYYGGTQSAPDSLITPATAGDWYWIGDPNLTGTTLQVPVTEWEKTGTGSFDFAWVRNALASFSTSKLSGPPTISALPSAAGIEWTSWEAHVGSYTYIYGVEDLGADKYMHIARVPGTSLAGTWSYYVGGDPKSASSWSSTESASIRVMDHMANEYSVQQLKSGLYMLTTMDTSQAFSANMVAYFSCTPTGPFVDETPLYTTPESGPYGSYGDANVYTYNAHVHTELSTACNLIVSYNVNSLDNTIGGDLYKDVSIYRPRFIDIKLTY